MYSNMPPKKAPNVLAPKFSAAFLLFLNKLLNIILARSIGEKKKTIETI